MRQTSERSTIKTSPRRRLLLPQSIRQAGAALMHQQCWLWGQDVKRPQENVLLDYGFTRHRAPETECNRGCTGYELLLPDGRAIVLWGFGLFLGDRDLGGMYVKRYGFSPKWLKESRLSLPIWQSEQLPKMRNARTPNERRRLLTLLVTALQWISQYEAWVIESRGLAYRRRCLAEWNTTIIPADQAVGRWQALQRECEILLKESE
ncbi:MAG: hypothetical protein JNJ50_22575 [Acidobacteria bacterium]|nr:hypothetical protein [Acidobacteriota bacterium]